MPTGMQRLRGAERVDASSVSHQSPAAASWVVALGWTSSCRQPGQVRSRRVRSQRRTPIRRPRPGHRSSTGKRGVPDAMGPKAVRDPCAFRSPCCCGGSIRTARWPWRVLTAAERGTKPRTPNSDRGRPLRLSVGWMGIRGQAPSLHRACAWRGGRALHSWSPMVDVTAETGVVVGYRLCGLATLSVDTVSSPRTTRDLDPIGCLPSVLRLACRARQAWQGIA